LPGFLEKKRVIAGWYREALAGVDGVSLVWEPAGARSNFWLNTVRADKPARAAKILTDLNASGLAARPLWAPCHRQPFLKSAAREELPVTDALWRTCVNVPSSASLTREDVEAVAKVVADR